MLNNIQANTNGIDDLLVYYRSHYIRKLYMWLNTGLCEPYFLVFDEGKFFWVKTSRRLYFDFLIPFFYLKFKNWVDFGYFLQLWKIKKITFLTQLFFNIFYSKSAMRSIQIDRFRWDLQNYIFFIKFCNLFQKLFNS